VSVWGEGLYLYNKKRRKFEQYGEEHLLSNNVIYKILEDNAGKLWLSTNKGISMFDLSKKDLRILLIETVFKIQHSMSALESKQKQEKCILVG